jgi:TPR repeat protein
MATSLQEGIERFEHGDFTASQTIFEKLAKEGDGKAQFYLGLLYFTGDGGEKNLTEAGNWFEKSARQKDPKVKGKKFSGISAEYDRALYWLKKIAEQGDVKAQFYLGVMYAAGRDIDIDYKKSAYWFEKAAEQGDELAQLNIGIYYIEGHGVSKNLEKGIAWLQKAAKQGNLKAQNYLGYLYISGDELEPDYTKARYWYEKAAEQEYPTAQYNLALMYCLGKGVDRNLTLCSKWTKKAYKNGLKQQASILWEKFKLWKYQQ